MSLYVLNPTFWTDTPHNNVYTHDSLLGSFFSLLGVSNGEEPVLGFAPTAAIVVIGFPLCAFLFYAAIVKAQDETEKDDKAFLSGK